MNNNPYASEYDTLKAEATRHYLNDIRELVKHDKCVQAEIDFYRKDTGVKGVQYGEKVQTSTRGDALESRVIKYIEQVEALEVWRETAAKDIEKAFDIVSQLGGVQGNVVRSHYICGAKFTEIAFAIGYTERQVYRFCREGLIDLYDLIPNDYKIPIHKAV